MRTLASIGLVFWYFVYFTGGGTLLIGGFPTQQQCELARAHNLADNPYTLATTCQPKGK